MPKLAFEGKSKQVYFSENDNEYIARFKDEVTAFNALKKASYSGKGSLCCAISTLIFKHLKENGIQTHFIDRIAENQQLWKRATAFPLEVIVRNIAAGSIVENLGISEGYKFNEPVMEFCYKNDRLGDPLVNEWHIQALSIATAREIDIIKSLSFEINQSVSMLLMNAGLLLVDLKLEYGVDGEGNLLLVDEISPDNMRIWDTVTLQRLDKDTFRRDLGSLPEAYQEVLKRLEGL